MEHPVFVPRLRVILNEDFWLSQYRWYIYYFQPRRIKYVFFLLLVAQFYLFRAGDEALEVPLPAAFSLHFANRENAKREPEADWMVLLSFDLNELDPERQRALSAVEFAQFIYYHFVHSAARFKIQFSDQSIVRYIERALFDSMEPLQFRQSVDLKIYDKMWNAVFRYLHQMTYEPFVVWMNTK